MEFLNEINEQVTEAITNAKYRGETSACITYNTHDGYIDVVVNDEDDTEVYVCPDEDKGREHPNIEAAVTEALPLWDEVEIETEDNDWPSHWVRHYGRI